MSRRPQPRAERQTLDTPVRLLWRDRTGQWRAAHGTMRNASPTGALVQCRGERPIPLFRLVQVQPDVEAPTALRPVSAQGPIVRAVVWRTERPGRSGEASGYALRFLVEPSPSSGRITPPHTASVCPPLAVAS